jgi:hypothetical protein
MMTICVDLYKKKCSKEERRVVHSVRSGQFNRVDDMEYTYAAQVSPLVAC